MASVAIESAGPEAPRKGKVIPAHANGGAVAGENEIDIPPLTGESVVPEKNVKMVQKADRARGELNAPRLCGFEPG